MSPEFTAQWQRGRWAKDDWWRFFSHQLQLHTAPWVDGSLGRPLSPPTAQCAPPHFGLLPSLFAASLSQICLFFVASLCLSEMWNRNNRTVRPRCLHRHTFCKTTVSSIKSNKAHWPWWKKDNLDHMLLNRWSPAAQKGWRVLFSLLPWDRSLFSID